MSGWPFECRKSGYNYYSGDTKWEPCGRSPDIPSAYTMGVSTNVTLRSLTISPSTVDNCSEYFYYSLKGPDVFRITHPGVSDDVFFWQVRIIYGVITIEEWPETIQIQTQFNTNISEVVRRNNVTNQNERNFCETPSKK
jgi:hypothetical protein